MHIDPKSLGFYMKCLNAFFKRRETIKFKRMCFLLNESPDKLLKKSEFRDLITRGVFTPRKEFGNPDQEYFIDYYVLRKVVMDSDLMRDIMKATDGKLGEII